MAMSGFHLFFLCMAKGHETFGILAESFVCFSPFLKYIFNSESDGFFSNRS
jgi:hypothetical protein